MMNYDEYSDLIDELKSEIKNGKIDIDSTPQFENTNPVELVLVEKKTKLTREEYLSRSQLRRDDAIRFETSRLSKGIC